MHLILLTSEPLAHMRLFRLCAIVAIINSITIATLVHPHFHPFPNQVSPTSFFEQFLYSSLNQSPWTLASDSKQYTGQWAIESPSMYPGFANDLGLVMKTPSSFHAISYRFNNTFKTVNDTLVLQYEVKTQNGLTCGGAYIKLLTENFNSSTFDNTTSFQLMFGPDKCGANDNVHLILNKLNPITKQQEPKHLVLPLMTRSTPLSTLYTLILLPDGSYEIRINGNVVLAGNFVHQPHLLNPPLFPPQEIIDELDFKPSDWDDLEYVADESVSKPVDYDITYGSSYIPDPSVVKPQGWLEDEPNYIHNPLAEQPTEWDEDEDGKWWPPIIKNPKCLVGCGKWQAPLIPNQNYKGPWIQPVKKNPNFQGEWEPRRIPNPHFYNDSYPHNFEPIGGLGFELWTIENDILFDNIYLGHSIAEAESIGNVTFLPKLELEHKDYEINKPKPLKDPELPPKTFDQLIEEDESVSVTRVLLFFQLLFKREMLNMKDWWYTFNRDPLTTLTDDPLKALVYGGIFLFIFTFGFGILNIIFYLISLTLNKTPATQKSQESIESNEPGLLNETKLANESQLQSLRLRSKRQH